MANLLEINSNSVALYHRKIRQVISHLVLEEVDLFDGAIELDEGYFDGIHKCKRGWGGAGKVVVFGILKRRAKVYAKVVLDTKGKTIMPIITSKIVSDSVVYIDSYGSYSALDVSLFYHERRSSLLKVKTTSMV